MHNQFPVALNLVFFCEMMSSLHCHVVKLILRNSSVFFFIISNDFLLFLDTLLTFWKASFAIPMPLQTSLPHVLYSFKALGFFYTFFSISELLNSVDFVNVMSCLSICSRVESISSDIVVLDTIEEVQQLWAKPIAPRRDGREFSR